MLKPAEKIVTRFGLARRTARKSRKHRYSTPGNVEADIAPHDRLRGLGLEEARRLLGVDAELVHKVALHESETREVAAGAIWAGAVWLGRVRSTAVAPQRDRGAPRLDECIVA